MDRYRVPVATEDRIKAGLAMQLVAAATQTPVEAMQAGRISLKASRARWLSLYLAYTTLGWTLERVGHVFGLNRETVSRACRWAEDERDRPALDSLLDRLEACLRDALSAPRWSIEG